MTKVLRTATLWLWGGFLYCAIEVLWRGHSHPSMFIVGGLCFLLIGGINNHLSWTLGLVWQSVIGAAAVTVAELLSGVIINLWLGWGVWDYSHMPLNVLGQICLPYSIAWIALSALGLLIDDYLRWILYGDERPRYTLF